MKNFCKNGKEPIYLIDFLLDGETYNQSINGINFRKILLKELYEGKEVPSLFITNASNTNMDRVKQYCENEVKNKIICDFKPKHNDWNDMDFKRDVINFIQKAKIRKKIIPETTKTTSI